MTVLPIRIVGDPILGMATTPLPVIHEPRCIEERRDLIADMRETLACSGGVGLSANQIGSVDRIFVYDCPEAAGHQERRSGVVINPVLARSGTPQRTSDDADVDVEGCLSVPGLTFPVARSDWAEVRGFDEYGQPVVVAGSGVFARMLQHEIDHLNGRLYIDRLVGIHAERVKDSLEALARSEWGRMGAWTPGTDRHPFRS
ncbi:MAG: peptide deformylase [Actinomycetota bacterium]